MTLALITAKQVIVLFILIRIVHTVESVKFA